jgi:carbon monoxide dehydrogenase subunit G
LNLKEHHGHARQPRARGDPATGLGRAEQPRGAQACIPGCDKVEATGENQYAVGVAVKIGPVAAKFGGKIR